MVPQPTHLTVVVPEKQPGGAQHVMEQVCDAINAQLPFRYRLDKQESHFVLVPVRQRDQQGRPVDVVPLLDRMVTIPPTTAPVNEIAHRMAKELSRQTGLTVSCCQSFVAGIPWGMSQITYSATQRPARDILRDLIRAARGRQRWVSRCDTQWCFIELY